MKAGVNLTATNDKQETALHLAAKSGHVEVPSTLLENTSRGARVDADAIFGAGRTALHNVAQNGQMDAVKTLVENGADKGVKDENGQTAQDRATVNRYSDVAQALGQELDAIDGRTALHRAAMQGRLDRVHTLLR